MYRGIKEFQEHDIKRDKYIFENYGYKTLRIISIELNVGNRKQLISTIETFLEL